MRSGSSLLGLPSLFFIYLLLGILGTLFASTFFSETVKEGSGLLPLVWVVFFSIPAVLSAFLLFAVIRLVRDVLAKRVGGKLRARLLAFFFATAILSSLPSIVIASRFVAGIADSWFTAELDKTLDDANWFALDSYRRRLDSLERLAVSDFPAKLERAAANRREAESLLAAADPSFLCAQGFSKTEKGEWKERFFAGDRGYSLAALPAERTGFLPRDLTPSAAYPKGRDRDVVRYVVAENGLAVSVLTLSLGEEFDQRTVRLNRAVERVGAVGALRPELSRTLGLMFAAFLLPSLLMTLLIAFSLTDTVTQPVVSLADATRRVAEGDFSIRILERPGDELGALIASFNAMVRELENSRNALLRTEKINIWQELAQRLAHEIKNPLTPIKLSAERVLRRAKNDPERLGEILESCMIGIIQEVDGLTTMLTDFRSFSRMPPPLLERLTLRPVVEDAITLYRSSYPGVEFDCENVAPDLQVDLDRRNISHVLANLLINAIDAMEGRGKIEFRAELVKKKDSRYCRISIRDNGKGIPEEARQHVFTPYFTTKDTGTGLGLPIVERIVNDHGGSIWFDTAEGVGTTFYIDLPIRN